MMNGVFAVTKTVPQTRDNSVDPPAHRVYSAFMPRPGEVARFLRAAVKAGMRLQRSEGTGKTVADLQRIKVSLQKTRNRRSKES